MVNLPGGPGVHMGPCHSGTNHLPPHPHPQQQQFQCSHTHQVSSRKITNTCIFFKVYITVVEKIVRQGIFEKQDGGKTYNIDVCQNLISKIFVKL
jgi:hypothetical protein